MATLVQFLSYDGTFVGIGGAADGKTSTDIGVTENGSGPVGNSLRMTGTGSTYQDFTWNTEAASSFGSPNPGQTFQADPGDAAPAVTLTTPLDGATNVPANAPIKITFSEPVTLGAEAAILSCKEATLAPTDDPKVFEFVYLPPLPAGATCSYTIDPTKVHDVDANDPPDEMASPLTVSFTVATPVVVSTDVKVSQVYGGGGNAGAEYRNDFIELFNRSAADVSVAGWSVQYASSTGTTWQVTPSDRLRSGRQALPDPGGGRHGWHAVPAGPRRYGRHRDVRDGRQGRVGRLDHPTLRCLSDRWRHRRLRRVRHSRQLLRGGGPDGAHQQHDRRTAPGRWRHRYRQQQRGLRHRRPEPTRCPRLRPAGRVDLPSIEWDGRSVLGEPDDHLQRARRCQRWLVLDQLCHQRQPRRDGVGRTR